MEIEMRHNSPVYKAIQKIINVSGLKKTIHVYSYKEEKHFNQLWGLLSPNPESLSDKLTIVIVWDGIPERGIDVVDTNKYLTPIDWAVGVSLAIKNGVTLSQNKSYPDLKILILDFDSRSISRADSLRFVNQFPERRIMSMPWIRLLGPGAENLVSDIINPDILSMKEAFKKGIPDMDIIRNIWSASLTRPTEPGDHHAIANLIGHQLILADESSQNDSHLTALRALMGEIGLLSKDENSDSLLSQANPWVNRQESKWKRKLNEFIKDDDTRLNLILVDDMFPQGWGKMLCWAVGAEYEESGSSGAKGLTKISQTNDGKISVHASSSPQWILDKLGELEKGNMDQRFNFCLTEKEPAKISPEILFLDLRLFSGIELKVEVNFFKDLIKIAKKLKDNQHNNLPWPGFSADEIDRVEEWTNKPEMKREDPVYIEALTFLPRILALTDLSLPIILFSSTGRRDITEKLKPYGNIITNFEKPRFTIDIADDIAEQTKKKFQDAVDKAFTILRGRRICRAVTELGKEAKLPMPVSNPAFNHIEIYIDESGSADEYQFSLGGLVLMYLKYKKVFALNDALKKEGVYWYSNDENDERYLSKRPTRLNESHYGGAGNTDWTDSFIVKTFTEECTKNGISAIAVCVSDKLGTYSSPNDRHFPLKDISGDSRFVRLLSTLLELVLFELIPNWIPSEDREKVTVSVFVGTRTLRVKLTEAELMDKSENPEDYFGFGELGGRGISGRYYTISHNSICTIVAHILSLRSDMPDCIAVHHARGVTLNYGVPHNGKNVAWEKIRIQHYLADHVLGNKELYEEHFANGFDTEADADMYTLLQAQRELLDENVTLAIKMASSCKKVDEEMHGQIMKKIAESLNTIKGFGFVDICQAEDPQEPLNEKESVTVRKIIKRRCGLKNGLKFECERGNGGNVIIAPNQTKKLYSRAYEIEQGTQLLVNTYWVDGKLYGNNIEIV